VLFKPRGWTWIDPLKEVNAYKQAVRSGFMTVSEVIRQTSEHSDAEDVFKERRSELDMMADMELVFDTDAAQVNTQGIAQPNPAPPEEDDKEAEDPDDTAPGGDPSN
jgi:capsid protein